MVFKYNKDLFSRKLYILYASAKKRRANFIIALCMLNHLSSMPFFNMLFF